MSPMRVSHIRSVFVVGGICVIAPHAALAQEAQKPATVEQIAEQANGLISALADQRNAAMNENAQLRAQVVKMQRELDVAKAAKSEDKK